MPDPSIIPQALGATTYTVTNSKRLLVDLSLDVSVTSFPVFDVTYPSAAAGLHIKLIKGATELDLLPGPINDSTTFANRIINASSTPVGANATLSCEIRASAMAASNETWTVKVFSTSVNTYVFNQSENIDGDLTITRILSDPIASFSLGSTTVPEKTNVTLTAAPAKGPAGAMANIFPTAIGTPQPTVQYKWDLDAATISVSGFPACDASQTHPFQTPGVYGNRTIGIKVETWFDGTCPATAGFLNNSSAFQSLTIQPRPQYLMFVLDRSGSMSGAKWENAKTGARILTNLFAALRSGVSSADRVGILVFEDSSCTWHTPTSTIDPLISARQPLTEPAAADGSICTLDLGPAGSCTPIGDGVYKAAELLNGLPVTVVAPKYTIILLTDGYENSGTIRVSASTTVPALSPPVRPLSTALGGLPNVSELATYTIGLGSMVQEDVLDHLPLPTGAGRHGGVYRHVTDLNQIKEAIAEMVGFSQDAQSIVPLGTAPTDAGALVGHLAQHRYFELDPKVNRLCLAIEWSNSTDTITLQKRDFATGSFSGQFQNVSVIPRQCPQHGFVTVELPSLFGTPGNENIVPATQWRVLHTNSTGTPQTIPLTDLMIFVDLYLKVEIVFDKLQYRTGDEMVITAQVRAGSQPVTGATITVELARPGTSLGTFLATNSKLYQPDQTSSPDPNHPKAAMIQGLLDRLEMEDLPVLHPSGPFADGTDRLFDDGLHRDGARDDGNYANVYNRLDQEGTYTWRFFARGTLADGSPYTRVLTISKWVGIKVDPATSQFKTEVYPVRSRGLVGQLVSVLPLDSNQQYLGPFRSNEVRFKTTVGEFQGAVESHLDGWYSRLLVYPENTSPKVSVIVQGQDLAAGKTEPVEEGCLCRIPIIRVLCRWLRGQA